MKFEIKYQETYSRSELILRALFGWLYILIPHAFLLTFLGIWSAILMFISFWVILFTGRYPQSFFEFQVDLMRWNNRLNARFYNLSDGYPAFGLKAEDEFTDFDLEYPETVDRGLVIIRFLFGFFYVLIPHGFILYFRSIAMLILCFLAFWVVLFTGKYPQSWHAFNVDTLRWMLRVNLYLMYMIDIYPPFNGKPLENAGDDFEQRDN
ncbi:MAG TPA: hypothetical protein DCX54_10155 [Flavobacteriales bacterium]|nr:hypothetical protein [Flavobacteriales bacterium]